MRIFQWSAWEKMWEQYGRLPPDPYPYSDIKKFDCHCGCRCSTDKDCICSSKKRPGGACYRDADCPCKRCQKSARARGAAQRRRIE